MEKELLKEIDEYCFRIILDFNDVDLGIMIPKLSKVSDFIFYDKTIYVWLKEGFNKKSLLSVMKACKVFNYFMQSLHLDEVVGKNDFLESFVSQHMTSINEKIIEENNQQALKEMLNNIERATKLLEEKIKEQKEGGANNA